MLEYSRGSFVRARRIHLFTSVRSGLHFVAYETFGVALLWLLGDMRTRTTKMKKAILAGAAVLIFSSSAALAQAVYVTPGYAEPAYVAPAPVYVAPAPVYVAPPATTVIVHRPIVRPARVVIAAAPVFDYAPGEVVLHSRW